MQHKPLEYLIIKKRNTIMRRSLMRIQWRRTRVARIRDTYSSPSLGHICWSTLCHLAADKVVERPDALSQIYLFFLLFCVVFSFLVCPNYKGGLKAYCSDVFFIQQEPGNLEHFDPAVREESDQSKHMKGRGGEKSFPIL